MVKGRNGEQRVCTEGMDPRESNVAIRFPLAIAQSEAGKDLISDGAGIRVYGNLIIILAQRTNHSKLVFWINIEDERPEPSIAIVRIVDHLRDGRLQSEVAAISVQAGVVSKSLCVPAATDLVVGLVEISEAEHKIAFSITFKPGAWRDVEDSIRSVS